MYRYVFILVVMMSGDVFGNQASIETSSGVRLATYDGRGFYRSGIKVMEFDGRNVVSRGIILARFDGVYLTGANGLRICQMKGHRVLDPMYRYICDLSRDRLSKNGIYILRVRGSVSHQREALLIFYVMGL
jgi:hypothetical protein